MGGPRVQQGEEAFTLNRHWQEQGMVRPDPCKSMHGDNESMSVSSRIIVQLRRGCVVVCGGGLIFLDVVCRLQVEQSWADMATDVLFITVVA